MERRASLPVFFLLVQNIYIKHKQIAEIKRQEGRQNPASLPLTSPALSLTLAALDAHPPRDPHWKAAFPLFLSHVPRDSHRCPRRVRPFRRAQSLSRAIPQRIPKPLRGNGSHPRCEKITVQP